MQFLLLAAFLFPLSAYAGNPLTIEEAAKTGIALTQQWDDARFQTAAFGSSESVSCPAFQLSCLVVENGAAERDRFSSFTPDSGRCRAALNFPYAPGGVNFYAELKDDFSLLLLGRSPKTNAVFERTEVRFERAVPGRWYLTRFWDAVFLCSVRQTQ